MVKILCYGGGAIFSIIFGNKMTETLNNSTKFKAGFYSGGKYYQVGNYDYNDSKIKSNKINSSVYHESYGTMRTDNTILKRK